MISSISDLGTLQAADGDSARSPRGIWRVGRRIANRCFLDRDVIHQPRVFCQNAGACGSTYVVELLRLNGLERAFHEKTPDLLETGLRHFDSPLPDSRLIRLLRYTRHDVFFEANNRLFSLSRQIARAFPNTAFIHLHRDGTEAVRSGMSKCDVPGYIRKNIRFRGTLAGPPEAPAFTRMCHHWANMNRRIAGDLAAINGAERHLLRFEDLVAGKTGPLETAIGANLRQKSCSPVNVRPTRQAGKFPAYPDWSPSEKETFDRICGPVMSLLGR